MLYSTQVVIIMLQHDFVQRVHGIFCACASCVDYVFASRCLLLKVGDVF